MNDFLKSTAQRWLQRTQACPSSARRLCPSLWALLTQLLDLKNNANPSRKYSTSFATIPFLTSCPQPLVYWQRLNCDAMGLMLRPLARTLRLFWKRLLCAASYSGSWCFLFVRFLQHLFFHFTHRSFHFTIFNLSILYCL